MPVAMDPLDGLAGASNDVSRLQQNLGKASTFITEVDNQNETELRDTSPSLLGTTGGIEAPLERIEQQAVPAELEPGYLRPGEALPIFGLPGPTPEAQIMQAAADTHRRSVLG